MRSADAVWRAGFTAALCALALGGCASATDALKSMRHAAPAGAQALPETSASAKVEADVAVDPTVQRAFDDARQALRAGRADEAERGFRALAQAHPELGGPSANLGVIHRRAGKLDDAAAELEQAVRASPRQPVYWNELGVTYRQQGQFGKARDAYEHAMALDASCAQCVLNLGILNDLYLWNGARALELYERYLALTPGGDATVTKWIADLKNRKPAAVAAGAKEKP